VNTDARRRLVEEQLLLVEEAKVGKHDRVYGASAEISPGAGCQRRSTLSYESLARAILRG
jgi:hypothetical protein